MTGRILVISIPLEEEKLIAIVGAQYLEYRQRTPAFMSLWKFGSTHARP